MRSRLIRLQRSTGLASRPTPRHAAFTLLETSMALVIIGVGVLAFVDANKSFIENNGWSSMAATGAYLANEVRELMRNLPRHDPVTGLYIDTAGGGETLVGWGPEAGELLVTDFNDIDDFDGLSFGHLAAQPGPINGFGEVVPETDADGQLITDGNGIAQPLRGWTQRVYVEKVDPANYGIPRGDAYVIPPAGLNPGRTVEAFPLRVTVIVEYQGPMDDDPREITRMMWIAPP